ncbi:class I SAM-dependent methyltransferase [Lysinibacillus xylanilyticus]|uniref:class I SAM-dependent methyltransferase n=1 Tax=Lysinibacillus xylanilyticus TaxID=582475 RepID=UPI0037F136DD
MKESYLLLVQNIGELLEKANIPYQFTGVAALFIQNVELNDYREANVSVQWDVFEEAYDALEAYSPSTPVKTVETSYTHFVQDGVFVTMSCMYNTTIRTDPYRLAFTVNNTNLWCRSLYSYLYNEEMACFKEDIHNYLAKEQQEITAENEHAWNQNNYLGLVNRHGDPTELAKKIRQNPKWRLHPFYKYLDEVKGKKITHIMGSNGIKAVALATLGGDVKVVDFSRDNAKFACEVAKASNVKLSYVVSDILSLSDSHLNGDQDIVLMELGVLHYLVDLHPLLVKVKAMLKPGGRFVLHEFHPVSTKLITSSGKKHKITGNYFAPSIVKDSIAFTKYMPQEKKPKLSKVIQKKWTMGELITVVGQSGLVIKVLEEEPNHKIHDMGLPKTFTLVAEYN